MEPTFSEFLIMFSLATLMMLVLASSIILFMVFYQKKMVQEQLKRQQLEFEFQQKMLQAELQSQETERRRLAADLHDSIGGMLSTIRVGISTMARLLPDPQSIDQTKQMLDDTIGSVRRISRDLMPSTLEKFGLVHALREICERFQATSKITIHFHEQNEIGPMDKSRELMIFRVVQELLNNAIKHSQATEINVSINSGDQLYVSVEDDGIGFNADEMKKDKQNGKGLGLFNIENRARLLGGNLDYDIARTKGSKTILTLPILHEQKA
jgi:two-component system NarL family sensor kinase